MNDDLLKLLKLTPGIVQRKNRGILCEKIDFADWTATLEFTNNVEVGNWVQVTKGTYKGDIGCVLRLETSGDVALLLVPRLPPLDLPEQSSSKKRKRMNRPEPELFNPNVTQETPCNPHFNPDLDVPWNYPPSDEAIPPKNYSIHGGNDFEHGLIVKSYSIRSLRLAVSIPCKMFNQFRLSGHPLTLASKFPKPIEWIFEEGEKVLITASGKHSTIHKVEVDGVEVELDNSEGKVKVGWLDFRKFCINGDYVEVLSGMHKGQSGWIQPSAFGIGLACIVKDNINDTEVKQNLFLLCMALS